MKVCLLSFLLALMPSVLAAEIVSWTDDDGVRHYTNVPEEIPALYRDTVETVVKDIPRAAESAPEPGHEERPRERPRMAQVVYQRPPVSEDYVRGFLEGVSYGRGGGDGGDVDIEGPLAIADAQVVSPPPAYPYYVDPYPLVTSAFDRGRSRHLTLRMLLQDQFQLDRGSPYFYPQRFFPPHLGVDLNPHHPRGLPRRFPRQTRVILR
jgi:hypothetical protein